MEMIAAGKGRKPKPFMVEGGDVQADAVWDSNRGLAAEERKEDARAGRKSKPATTVGLPDFIAPQLCQTWSVRPPAQVGFMRSSSTAIGSSCVCWMAR